MLEAIKSYTFMFGLEMSRQTSPRTTQGSLRKEGPKISVKAAEDNPNNGESRCPVGQPMPCWLGLFIGTYPGEERVIPWFHGIINTFSLSLVCPKDFLC